ncbi:MAG: hypothetical protein H6924_01590 [Alphaproteobacteria bacterium]|nr:hypothetical protein [Alphaproteobacteria bacterium]
MIHVRYIAAGSPVAEHTARTMFDARRLVDQAAAPALADRAVICAINAQGEEVEIESRVLEN